MRANIVHARRGHVGEAPDESGRYSEFLLADYWLRDDVLIIEH